MTASRFSLFRFHTLLLVLTAAALLGACGAKQDLGESCESVCQTKFDKCGRKAVDNVNCGNDVCGGNVDPVYPGDTCTLFCKQSPSSESLSCLSSMTCSTLAARGGGDLCGVSLGHASGFDIPATGDAGTPETSHGGTNTSTNNGFSDDGGPSDCMSTCEEQAGFCAPQVDGGGELAADAVADCRQLCSYSPTFVQVQCFYFSGCSDIVAALRGEKTICGIGPKN